MPPGFPVATVALDKAGARNAAWLAAQILALNDPALAAGIAAARRKDVSGCGRAAKKSTANTPEREGRKSAPSALWAQIWL